MLSLAILLVMADPLVSFQADAVRVDTLLADLARQSGQKVACDAAVAPEPLIVQFKDQPLEEVLKRVADVAGGEWVRKGDERRLTRSPSLRSKQEQADQAKLLAKLGELIANLKAESDKIPRYDEKRAALAVDKVRFVDMQQDDTMAELGRMAVDDPAYRAAITVMAGAGAGSLAKLDIGGRAVFSDDPTPMQRPVPKGQKAMLDELKGSIALMEAAKKKLGSPKKPYVNFGGATTIGPGSLAGGYGKTVFALKKMGSLSFSYEVFTVDGKGRSALAGEGYVPDYGLRFRAVYAGAGKPLEITPDVKTFVELRSDLGYAWASTSFAKLPDGTKITGSNAMSKAEASGRGPNLEVAGLLSDPVSRDPIGIAVGSLLRQVAAQKGKPLLATVSDATVLPVIDAISRKTVRTQDDFIGFLQQTGVRASSRIPYSEVEDGAWLMVKPIFPAFARRERINRLALKTLLSAIHKAGALSLDAAARYVATCYRPPTFGSLDAAIISHADPTVDKAACDMVFSSALPFLAQLNPAQWDALSNRRVKVSLLPLELQTIVRRWVFDEFRYDHLMELGKVLRSEAPGGRPGFSPIATEPTEMFPDGVPTTASVGIEVKSVPAAIVRTQAGFRLIFDADSLGYQEANPRAPVPDEEFVPRVIEGYTPASQRRFTITVYLREDLEPAISTRETKIAPGAAETDRNGLPSSLKKRIELIRNAFASQRVPDRKEPPPPKPNRP
jgi:hypothetical protein